MQGENHFFHHIIDWYWFRDLGADLDKATEYYEASLDRRAFADLPNANAF